MNSEFRTEVPGSQPGFSFYPRFSSIYIPVLSMGTRFCSHVVILGFFVIFLVLVSVEILPSQNTFMI